MTFLFFLAKSFILSRERGKFLVKLLLADDEVFIRNGLIKNIKWKDHGINAVETAEDGLDAFEKAMWFKPDILLTDIKMPRVDGIELAKKIGEIIPHCRIIFMSAYTDKAYLKSAIRLRAVDYIEKPFRPDEVNEIIAKVTGACAKSTKEKKNSSWIVSEIIKIINEEYSNSALTIAYICKRLFLSHSYICTAFKKHTDKTINQYITEYRIELAKMYLGDKRISLSDVAARVGFSDQNYFTKVFKRITKVTPSEYRNSDT